MLISKKKLKIAFQGMLGAYSNMACEECFPNANAIPCISFENMLDTCLLYTSPSPRDPHLSRMPSSA